jgi:hypothetical protein
VVAARVARVEAAVVAEAQEGAVGANALTQATMSMPTQGRRRVSLVAVAVVAEAAVAVAGAVMTVTMAPVAGASLSSYAFALPSSRNVIASGQAAA